MTHQHQRGLAWVRLHRLRPFCQHAREFGTVIQGSGDTNRHRAGWSLDATMVQVLAHDSVEGVGVAGEIPDLLVVAAVTRDEEWHCNNLPSPLPNQAGYGILKPGRARFRPHQETDFDRPCRPHLTRYFPDQGVPDRVAAVGNNDRPNGLSLNPGAHCR